MLTSVIFCVLSLVPHFVIKPCGCRSVDAKKRAHAILVRMLRDRSYFWLHVLIIFSQTNLDNASNGEWLFLWGCSGKKMCKPHKHWTYRCILIILDTCNFNRFHVIFCPFLSAQQLECVFHCSASLIMAAFLMHVPHDSMDPWKRPNWSQVGFFYRFVFWFWNTLTCRHMLYV